MHTQFARKVLMRVIGLLCLCLVLTTQHGWYDQLTHIFGSYGSIYNVDARGRALMAVTDHTPSFFSTMSTSLSAAVVIIAVGAVATAAGAGGGALFVPLFSAFLQFSVKDSTALSQAVITGGAVAGTSFALFQKHPAMPTCPLIQFDLALVLIPSLLLGTSIGVLLNQIFPVWLITLCLIFILTYLTYKTTVKGWRLYKQEQQNIIAASARGLQSVKINAESDQANSEAVHSLLRSISEEPISPQHSFPVSGFALDPHSNPQQVVTLKAAAPPLSVADSKLQHLLPTYSNSSASSGRIATSSAANDVELVAMADTTKGAKLHCKSQIPFPQAMEHVSGTDYEHNDDGFAAAGNAADNDDDDLADDDSIPFLTKDKAQAHHQTQMHPVAVNKFLTALRQLPWSKLTAAFALWVVFAGLQLLKAAAARCSTTYWLLYCVQATAAILASGFFIRAACQGKDPQPLHGAGQQEITKNGQCEWTHKVLMMAASVGVGGGALAGTVGMGGGVVMGPLLLYLQVPPVASAATSTLMILFSSSAATLSFAVDGHVNVQYAFIYGSLNFMSSFLGVFFVGRAVKRSGRSSIIVLLLALMMASGALISAVFGGMESVQDFKSGKNLAFSSLCV